MKKILRTLDLFMLMIGAVVVGYTKDLIISVIVIGIVMTYRTIYLMITE